MGFLSTHNTQKWLRPRKFFAPTALHRTLIWYKLVERYIFDVWAYRNFLDNQAIDCFTTQWSRFETREIEKIHNCSTLHAE